VLGKNHAVLGTAVWLTAVAVTARTDGLRGYYESVLPAAERSGTAALAAVSISTVVCAGAAVLPDLDEPQATAAKTFGLVGRGGAKTVRWLAGGHRQRTHTLLFAGLMALAGWWAAAIWQPDTPGWYAAPAVLLVGVCSVWGFLLVGRAVEDRGLSTRVSAPVALILGSASAGVVALPLLPVPEWEWVAEVAAGVNPRWWLPAVLGIGCAAHLLGDLLTKTGVPVLWPISRARPRLALFKVGGRGERVAGTLVVGWAIVAGTMAASAVT